METTSIEFAWDVCEMNVYKQINTLFSLRWYFAKSSFQSFLSSRSTLVVNKYGRITKTSQTESLTGRGSWAALDRLGCVQLSYSSFISSELGFGCWAALVSGSTRVRLQGSDHAAYCFYGNHQTLQARLKLCLCSHLRVSQVQSKFQRVAQHEEDEQVILFLRLEREKGVILYSLDMQIFKLEQLGVKLSTDVSLTVSWYPQIFWFFFFSKNQSSIQLLLLKKEFSLLVSILPAGDLDRAIPLTSESLPALKPLQLFHCRMCLILILHAL